MDVSKYRSKIQHKLSHMLEIPRDIVFDLPKMTMLGDFQLHIENHRGIIAYSPEKIRVAVSLGELEITGRDMVIRTITPDEIYLDGIILGVSCIR